MNWQKFENLFEPGWARELKKFIISKDCDEIFAFLKARGKEVSVFPSSDKLWKPFQLCNYKDLKLIIFVEGPYLEAKGSGLSLGWDYESYNLGIPKPLEILFNTIEKELYNGFCLECIQQNNLSYLAKQGILLLNIPMTGDEEIGPHVSIWESFISFLLQEITAYTGVPVIFLGNSTWKYEKYLSPFQERFLLEFPKDNWNSKEAFNSIQKILLEKNEIPIEWMEKLPF